MNESQLLRVGLPAPQWSAQAYVAGSDFKTVSSADFSGKWQILFFYPRDFTFVCPTEIRAFAAQHALFNSLNAEIIAASTDSTWSHKAWYEKDLPEVKYPVLADTTHAISRSFGVLIGETGEALRGTFIVDPVGVLRYAVVSDLNVGRSVDETIRVLQALQNGGRCPINWKVGDPNV